MSKELREQFEKETGMNFMSFPMLYSQWLESKIQAVKDSLMSDDEIEAEHPKDGEYPIMDFYAFTRFGIELQRERTKKSLK